MPENLTKRDIILKIYRKTGYPQHEIRDAVQLTLDAIAETLSKAGNVELRNFGVFQVQKRLARVGRNPRQPEKDVTIPDRAVVKFTAGKALKGRLEHLDLDKLG